ncbi:GNAT family N-acetyltransferase [Phytohalomonas tamaricis]|uniref:GNAT family N-acetyltransferase n=1 Tax=Phytohalomonas tamaricis TaxID=2081032 RepID=UPI000D0B62BB|nr:GNAT family N-acetyltransferase [Phytohalomonas tamaricis]
MSFEIQTLDAVANIAREKWNAVSGMHYPFLRHEFLDALEASGSVSSAAGWEPCHLTLWQKGTLVGLMPRYRKEHSYGEYVFDWQWADAWERAGGEYYPKGLTAIPFTPAYGPRLALTDGVDQLTAMAAVSMYCRSQPEQSWHLLFPTADEANAWKQSWPQLLERHGVQYHWQDRDYGDFEGFLAHFTSKRRKELKRERRKVADQGLSMRRLRGAEINREDLEHFYRCYQITYLERGQQGYLNFEFFARLLVSMPDALLLIQACEGHRPVAAALCFEGIDTLYGRYWGSEVAADCLHFETCYYQGIAYCLERGLKRFDPGTQGEHKIPRGFEPVLTRSLHWLADDRFRDAVDDFLGRERPAMAEHLVAARTLLPFHRQS